MKEKMFATKKNGPAVDFDKPVPTPKEVSEELRTLTARFNRVTAEQAACDEGQRAIYRETAEARRNDDRENQIDAIITGSAYEPPADARDRMAAFARKRSLLAEAAHELANLIRAACTRASILIAAEFKPEQDALAREFYRHLALAVAAHSKFGNIRQRLERAGVDSGSLHDFGRNLCGVANSRTDHASFALKDAVRRGYLDKADVPAGYL
jgi:hypothetical protein